MARSKRCNLNWIQKVPEIEWTYQNFVLSESMAQIYALRVSSLKEENQS